MALLETAVLLCDTTATRTFAESLKVAVDLVVVDNSPTVVARQLGVAMRLSDDALLESMLPSTACAQLFSWLAAYDRAGLPTIDPYPSDAVWSCFETNPSCGRDPWWAEWNGLQDASHVTYFAVGPRFTTERRFEEAVDLLWQWPEGKQLLSQADQTRVLVMTRDYDQQTTAATYSSQRKHAADDAHGVNTASTTAACLAGETAATGVQQRFLVWLTRTLKPQGLPFNTIVTARLAPEQADLATSLYRIGFSTNLPKLVSETYDGTC